MSLLGTEAVLFDVAGSRFDEAAQRRVWAVCEAASRLPGVREAVPGMNNLVAVFDPRETDPDVLAEGLRRLWSTAEPLAGMGRLIEAPTVYGGETGPDLNGLAERTGLAPEAAARLHAETEYTVAAVGAFPGFVYLSGLDPRLAWPRLASPRSGVREGSVIIGGSQTGIMPCTAPSGWHVIGRTTLRLFDAARDEPAACRPGDRLRFRIVGVEP